MKEHDRHLMDLWDGNAAPQNDEDRLWLGLKDELRTLKPNVESRTQFADVMREVRLSAPVRPARRPWWKWAVPSGAVAAASLYFVLIARPDMVPQPEVTQPTNPNLAMDTQIPAPATGDASTKITSEELTPQVSDTLVATAAPGSGSSARRTSPRRSQRNSGPVASRVVEDSPITMSDMAMPAAAMRAPGAAEDVSPDSARGGASNEAANATFDVNPQDSGPKVVVVGNRPSASTGVPKATEAPLTDVVFGG